MYALWRDSLLLNGPNLNLLGQREPEVYGSDTLASIEERAKNAAAKLGHEVVTFQSNAEHELIACVQTATGNGISFAVVNPGGFTHTSVALRDALLGVKLPFIELHLSNTFAREKFRHHSYFSDVAVGCIVGLGALGYELGHPGRRGQGYHPLMDALPARQELIKDERPLDIRKVKKLIELLEESGIAEIEIKEGEEAVRISRMPTGATLRICSRP